jgi:hypothetical protein
MVVLAEYTRYGRTGRRQGSGCVVVRARGICWSNSEIADGVVVAVGDVLDGGGDEVGGGEDLEVALGFPVAAGAVDDGGGFFFPGDLLQGEGGAQEVFGEVSSALYVVRGDGFFSGVEVETAVSPGKEVAGFPFCEQFVVDEPADEAVAEEFGEGVEGGFRNGGKEVEEAGVVEEAAGAEDVKMRMPYKVIAEGLDAGDGGEFALCGSGEAELGAHPVVERFGGGAKEVVEEVAALTEDAAQLAGNGEDELAMRNGLAQGFGDPAAGGADAALVAGRADVATLAGEG